jgi:hypothetical protein
MRAAILLVAAACGNDLATECAAPFGAVAGAAAATAADVAPILARSCALGGCHLVAPGAGGLVLDVAAGTWPGAVVGVPSQQSPELALVAPGAPEDSWLARKLYGAFCAASCDPALGCGGPMPVGRALPEAERAIIVAWIAGGALATARSE